MRSSTLRICWDTGLTASVSDCVDESVPHGKLGIVPTTFAQPTMSAPSHDFLLLPDSGDRASQYVKHLHDPSAVRVDDDLVHYMNDSLRWAPSENLAMRNAAGFGLTLYGPTAFSGDGARQLVRVLNAWSVLFRCGPEILELTRCYGHSDEADAYDRVPRRRDDVIETLERLAALAEEAVAPGHWLLHLGI